MKKKRLDILNLEWPKSDRDLHIVTPVLLYLQKRYNISFKSESIFNGYYYLYKYRPKLLLISNFGGASINHEIVKMAFSMGIKVVSFISEGNVKAEGVDQFLWGWNHDKKLYVDKMLLWTTRSQDLFVSRYPQLSHKFYVSGATGFDRYKLLHFKSKEQFLKENNLSFSKVVGIAGWGFDHLFGSYYQAHKENYLKIYGKKQVKMHREDLFLLQRDYASLIQNNPDTLFILRYHPGTIDFEKNEFFGLEKYPNVFISSTTQNSQYQISDLINISDLWIGYETTTALEAWLLGKETFLLNPTRSDFVRENVYKGSIIVKSSQEAQRLLDEFFQKGSMVAFSTLAKAREDVIKEVIEYGDGKNHRRAAGEIVKVFQTPSGSKIQRPLKLYKEIFKQIVKLLLSKTILKKRWPEMDYSRDFAKKYQDMYEKVI